MANEATVFLKGDSKNLDKELKESSSMLQNWGKVAVAAVGAIGAAFAIRKVVDFGGAVVDAYNAQIEAETKLQSVLRATGNAAGFSSERLQEMASAMQATTGVGDEVILNAMAIQATFRNIRGDNFRATTQAALDMATVLDMDLTSATMQLSKALNDPVKGMTMLTRAGVTFTDAQKDMVAQMVATNDVAGAQQVILEELNNQFGGAAADQLEAFGGKWDALSGRLGDVMELIASGFIPVLETFMPLLDSVVTVVENLAAAWAEAGEGAGEFAEDFSTTLVDAFKWVVDSVATAVSLLEFYWTNWFKVIDKGVNQVILMLVSMTEEVKYTFTERIPQYLNWFAENWVNILTDIRNFQLTVFANMMVNVQNFFTSIMNLLQGNPADFQFTALTKGFEMTTKALPEIAARNLTDTEKELQQYIDTLDGQLDEDYRRILEKNQSFAEGLFKKGEKLDPEEITPDLEFEAVDKEDVTQAKAVKKELKDGAKEVKTALGTTTGLESLAKDIQSAVLAGGDGESLTVGGPRKRTVEQAAARGDMQRQMNAKDASRKILEEIRDGIFSGNDLLEELNTGLL